MKQCQCCICNPTDIFYWLARLGNKIWTMRNEHVHTHFQVSSLQIWLCMYETVAPAEHIVLPTSKICLPYSWIWSTCNIILCLGFPYFLSWLGLGVLTCRLTKNIVQRCSKYTMYILVYIHVCNTFRSFHAKLTKSHIFCSLTDL